MSTTIEIEPYKETYTAVARAISGRRFRDFFHWCRVNAESGNVGDPRVLVHQVEPTGGVVLPVPAWLDWFLTGRCTFRPMPQTRSRLRHRGPRGVRTQHRHVAQILDGDSHTARKAGHEYK